MTLGPKPYTYEAWAWATLQPLRLLQDACRRDDVPPATPLPPCASHDRKRSPPGGLGAGLTSATLRARRYASRSALLVPTRGFEPASPSTPGTSHDGEPPPPRSTASLNARFPARRGRRGALRLRFGADSPCGRRGRGRALGERKRTGAVGE